MVLYSIADWYVVLIYMYISAGVIL